MRETKGNAIFQLHMTKGIHGITQRYIKQWCPLSHTCVTGWWRSTITELMGGATPITWRLLRAVLPTSGRAVMRAVTVFEGFCWLAVMTRPLTWNNKHYCILYTCDYCIRDLKTSWKHPQDPGRTPTLQVVKWKRINQQPYYVVPYMSGVSEKLRTIFG